MINLTFCSFKEGRMNEELFDIEGENKIPEDKKGNIEQEVLTLEEIEKLLLSISENKNVLSIKEIDKMLK